MSSSVQSTNIATYTPKHDHYMVCYRPNQTMYKEVFGKGIEALINRIKNSKESMLIATGKFGLFFNQAADLDTRNALYDSPLYEYKESSDLMKSANNEKLQKSVIVLGAQKSESREVVFIAYSDEITDRFATGETALLTTPNTITPLQGDNFRVHRFSSIDSRIFAISYITFMRNLETIHAPLEVRPSFNKWLFYSPDPNLISLAKENKDLFKAHFVKELLAIKYNMWTVTAEIGTIGSDIFGTYLSINKTPQEGFSVMDAVITECEKQMPKDSDDLLHCNNALISIVSQVWQRIGVDGLTWTLPPNIAKR